MRRLIDVSKSLCYRFAKAQKDAKQKGRGLWKVFTQKILEGMQ